MGSIPQSRFSYKDPELERKTQSNFDLELSISDKNKNKIKQTKCGSKF